MDRKTAAALLGVAMREVRSVDDNWIVTVDGAHYEVPDPDASVLRWVRTNPQQTPPRYHAELATGEDAADDEDPALDVDGDDVPDGTAKQILDWVAEDEDPEQSATRARAALAAEQAKGTSARKSLVAELEKLTG